MIAPNDLCDLIAALPLGSGTGTASGKRYITTRNQFGNGRPAKVVAEELGGTDYVSLNYFRLTRGPRFYPCEMPAAKVIAFLRNYKPDLPS